jgi:hypothetical protein
MRKLLERLSEGEMDAVDAAMILGFTPSGVRKYLVDMVDAGVMVVLRHDGANGKYPGRAIYCLNVENQRAIASFRELLDSAPPLVEPTAVSPTNQARPTVPGSTIHTMDYDARYSIRTDTTVPARDATVALIFGAPPVHDSDPLVWVRTPKWEPPKAAWPDPKKIGKEPSTKTDEEDENEKEDAA